MTCLSAGSLARWTTWVQTMCVGGWICERRRRTHPWKYSAVSGLGCVRVGQLKLCANSSKFYKVQRMVSWFYTEINVEQSENPTKKWSINFLKTLLDRILWSISLCTANCFNVKKKKKETFHFLTLHFLLFKLSHMQFNFLNPFPKTQFCEFPFNRILFTKTKKILIFFHITG